MPQPDARDHPKGMEEMPLPADIRIGDWVRLRPMARDQDMTPNDLRKIGWPNEWKVANRRILKDRRTGEKVDSLTLQPCCYHMRNPASGQYLCMGHDTILFERIPAEEIENPRPNAFFQMNGPGGQLLNLSYFKGENGPRLVFEGMAGSRGVEISGDLARQLSEKLKEWGVF